MEVVIRVFLEAYPLHLLAFCRFSDPSGHRRAGGEY